MPRERRSRVERTEKVLTVLAIVTLVAAYFIPILAAPKQSGSDPLPELKAALPEAQNFRQVAQSPVVFEAYATDKGSERLVGYVAAGLGTGYEGKVRSVVAADTQGKIISVTVVDNTELTRWLERVYGAGFLEGFAGRQVSDPLTLGQDLDAVSGATFTSRGIADGVQQAAHAIARVRQTSLTVQPAQGKLTLDLKAGLVLALWVVAIAGFTARRPKLRWVTLLASLSIVGFWLAAPLTFSSFAALLLGQFPPLDTAHLVWYLLAGGTAATLLVFGRNLHCYWICPFGGLLEVVGRVGGGGLTPRAGVRRVLRLSRPVLTWGALMIIFVTRTPSKGSYEPFGTAFTREGSGLAWAFLILVLAVGLFYKRFWCLRLCPVGYTLDLVASWRRWVARRLRRRRR